MSISHGTGFQPGETVNMIVVELTPNQQSFEPWDVVADENGDFETSWYIFSEEFRGATFQATATGQSSQLTASATFTDAGCYRHRMKTSVEQLSVMPLRGARRVTLQSAGCQLGPMQSNG